MELMMADLSITLIDVSGQRYLFTAATLMGDLEVLEKHDDPTLVVDNTETHEPKPPRYILTLEGEILQHPDSKGFYSLVEIDKDGESGEYKNAADVRG